MCILLSIIGHTINKAHHARYDGNPRLEYFSPDDLGLAHSDFSFKSGKWTIHGSRYWVDGTIPAALVVFFHGIGAGRNAYMKEIATICRHGYLVYAFDYTGCMESEGPYIYGLGHVSKDLDAFFAWLDQDEIAFQLPRFAIGHSWGGYAALLSSKECFGVRKIVSFSGFTQVSRLYSGFLRSYWMRKLTPLIRLFLFLEEGASENIDAASRLRKSNSELLYIQGSEDRIVSLEAGLNDLRRRLPTRPNSEYVMVIGQDHNPYLTPNAEAYLNEISGKKVHSVDGPADFRLDIEKATEENHEVWKKVFDFLGR